MTRSKRSFCADHASRILEQGSLFKRLQAGHTLVTGNRRLSRAITSQYSQWRIRQGDCQWQSPDILSWNHWLDRLWETASLQGVDGTERAVPGEQQLTSLWAYVLRQDSHARYLLRPESLLNQLRDTRRLITEWQLDVNDPAWFGDENENHTAFHHLNQAFDKRCHRDNWISPEDRAALLCNAIKNSHLSLNVSIDLLGFDEFNPGQRELLSALIDNGNTVSRLTIASEKKDAVLWEGKDSKDELQQMARWVRYWFENETESRIAIVVPDLQEKGREVERHLNEILHPGRHDAGQRRKSWNISLGKPLARVPLVETAFDLFKLLDHRIDIQDIARVLRSPWIQGGISERNNRALLEKCLRDSYPRQIKLSEVRYRASEFVKYDLKHKELPQDQREPQIWNSPQLCTVLNTLIQFERNNKGSSPASVWAEAFDQLLVSLGWPLAGESGNEYQPANAQADIEAEEHSRNWQELQAWRDALRELASLDATLPSFGRKQAIRHLTQICQEHIFQEHTPPASIQVLGLYEISGLRFDHLWVLGLHNDNWPPGARPNPFVPGRLQRDAKMPHSSPQRELEVAHTITLRLLETAPDCIFSYPRQIDGEPVPPSPLLGGMTTVQSSELPGFKGESWLTTVAGAAKPRITPLLMPGKLKHGSAKGGSSILKHQALCPFRAFASNRLGAEGLETPADGVSPMAHGSLMHGVLEYFWKETKSQFALLQLDKAGLATRVREQVDRVINNERGLLHRPAFRGVEADRLFRLVMNYLKLEKTRDSFEVMDFEKEILPEIEGQAVRLVIDRIDKLADGQEAVIDYKSGRVEPRKWFGERPEDPQLPLYAISADKTPGAVVFAVIRDDGCFYSGVVKQGGMFPNLPPKKTKTTQYLVDAGRELPETVENWRQILHRLMADFLAGEAVVDPKNGRNTCDNSYCELQSLCRIGELEQRHKTRQEAPI